jgi:hypothetical protein
MRIDNILSEYISNIYCGLVLFIILLLLLIFHLVINRRDDKDIHKEIEGIGGKIISIELDLFAPGWYFRRMVRIYKVRYIDANGIGHLATCKSGTFASIYWIDKLISK